MKTVFSIGDQGAEIFRLEKLNDDFLVTNGLDSVEIPASAFEPLYGFLRQEIEKRGGNSAPLPPDVRRLVITAREVWEDATDSSRLCDLDRALEPFSSRVPYDDQPEPDRGTAPALAAPDGWHCGNGNLRDQFTMAMLVSGKASCADMDDLDYLALQCGPLFTGHAIRRLLPGVLVLDDQIPF